MTDGMVAALPRRHRNVPRLRCLRPQNGEDGEMNDMMIGVDLAKNVFQAHGALRSGEVQFRKKLTRQQFTAFMARQTPCLVIFEAALPANFRGVVEQLEIRRDARCREATRVLLRSIRYL